MPVLDISTDYYELQNDNFTGSSFLKNGIQELGRNDRDAGYVAETLILLDLSGIPAGSTIDDVEIKFTIQTQLSGGTFTPSIHEQNKGSVTDNGSTTPSYDLRAPATSFSTTAWPAAVAQFDAIITTGSTGVQICTTAPALEALIQDILDTTKPNDGLIIQGNTGFFSWFLEFDTIEVNVTYTAPLLPKMIIM